MCTGEQLRIRLAGAGEATLVSSIGIRSKALWGYDEAAMAVFREELLLTGEDLVAGDAHVAAQRQSGKEVVCG